jgi:signal transduction histidine kinase
MSRKVVLAFVVAVNLTALAGFLLLAHSHVPAPLLGMTLLASLAVITGTSPVKVPSTTVSVSVSDAFLLTALGAFGPMPACVVGFAAAAGATIGKERHKNPVHIAFNLGNMVASSAAASAAYLMTGGVPGAPIAVQVAPLFAATGSYFVSNTLLVSTAIYLDTGRGFLGVWKESAIWTAVSTFAGLTFAACLIWALGMIGPTGLALGVPPAWVLTMFHRTHKERQLQAQERVNQVQGLNAVLEEKVAERTQELQHALVHIERANERLVAANSQLQEANRAKSLFLANVSHELRTPLNAVIGFSDLLREPATGALNEEQAGYVADIQESGEHLLRLINDILDLTKIEAGKLEACLAPVEVGRALHDAVAMLRPQAGRKQLSVEVAAGGDLVPATLDENLFRQVLINLLSNAVKFTPRGGRIVVSARRDDLDLVVQVADTGIGIAAPDLERVFEEFYQVDNSYSRQYEGTGLGLALVRRMVELQSGTITAESKVGEGSRFTCRFRGVLPPSLGPVAEPVPAHPAPARMRASAPASGIADEPASGARGGQASPTIVLVEDNPMNRKLARNVLRSHGYRIVEATSGEQALGLIAGTPADLILMDLQLPGMDGLELTRRLKADPHTATVPIVALTAHALEADESMAREAGCVGFITKPIRLATLPVQVATYLRVSVPTGRT